MDIKGLAKNILYYSGAINSLLHIATQIKKPGLLIINYHSISSTFEKDSFLGLPVDIFEEHLKVIRTNFKIVTLKKGLELLERDRPRGLCVAITFDDGYMDNYINAYPLLKKYNIPATIFLTTDCIGKDYFFWWDNVFYILSSLDTKRVSVSFGKKRFCFRLMNPDDIRRAANAINNFLRQYRYEDIKCFLNELEGRFPIERPLTPKRMLGWDEIKTMAKDIIEFGSHTKTHRNLSLMSDEEVLEELIDSKCQIEKNTGLKAAGLSYPFGIFDDRVKYLAKKAGFEFARSTLKGVNQRDTDRFSLASLGAGGVSSEAFLMNRVAFTIFRR